LDDTRNASPHRQLLPRPSKTSLAARREARRRQSLPLISVGEIAKGHFEEVT
jgi:hypothetical protein